VVGRIETWALEVDADRGKQFVQGCLTALGTLAEQRILKALLALELHSAVAAAVRVDWHR
jgi:hypothetical protein